MKVFASYKLKLSKTSAWYMYACMRQQVFCALVCLVVICTYALYIYLLYIYTHNQARHCLESLLALLARTAAMVSLKECTQEDWLKCWDEGGHTRWHQNEVDQ